MQIGKRGESMILPDQLKLDKYYTGMVACWLREIAINSLSDPKPYSFVDVVEDIRTRAIFGLENYFKDMRLKEQIELGEKRQ